MLEYGNHIVGIWFWIPVELKNEVRENKELQKGGLKGGQVKKNGCLGSEYKDWRSEEPKITPKKWEKDDLNDEMVQ